MKSCPGRSHISSLETVRQEDFAKTLAKVLKKPCFFTTPAWVIKLVLGGLGEVLLLSSSNMNPEKLVESGFGFQNLHLEEMLRQFFSK